MIRTLRWKKGTKMKHEKKVKKLRNLQSDYDKTISGKPGSEGFTRPGSIKK